MPPENQMVRQLRCHFGMKEILFRGCFEKLWSRMLTVLYLTAPLPPLDTVMVIGIVGYQSSMQFTLYTVYGLSSAKKL